MRDEEFFNLTPAQSDAFFGRLDELIKETDFRAGMLAAVMASGLSGKPFSPSDFFPRLKTDEPADQGDSPEQLKASMGYLRMAMQAQAAPKEEVPVSE